MFNYKNIQQEQNNPAQEREDMARWQILDSRLTAHMGGVLPEIAQPGSLRRVLDVGCGIGGWLLETARSYPGIQRLVGVDIDRKRVAYARAQAKAQGLDGRVRYKAWDARQTLPFPDACFSLVSQRLGACWACTWDWGKLLAEYQRLTRPGGIIRLTEVSSIEATSPALKQLQAIMDEAASLSGACPARNLAEKTGGLQDLMSKHGIEGVTSRHLTVVERAGAIECESYRQKMAQLLLEYFPALAHWLPVPSDYQQICEQAVLELQQPDLMVRWDLLTVTGNKPVLMPGLMSC